MFNHIVKHHSTTTANECLALLDNVSNNRLTSATTSLALPELANIFDNDNAAVWLVLLLR